MSDAPIIKHAGNAPRASSGAPGPTLFSNLREYQREGVLCAFERLKKTTAPILLCMPTGAGKSWVIANMAAAVCEIVERAGGGEKKVLALAPSRELVVQNREKMKAAGFRTSTFSQSAGEKDASGTVIFATPKSFDNALDKLSTATFAAVFIDEAHEASHMVARIVAHLRQGNPNLRVMGLTATPFKLSSGYIFRQNTFRGLEPLSEDYARSPFFEELVYEIPAHELIDLGFLCPPVIGSVQGNYNTEKLKRAATGYWTNRSSDQVFGARAQAITREIIKDVKQKAKAAKGVMIFCHNIEHAGRVLKLLPEKQTGYIDGSTEPEDRDQAINLFKRRKLKYLVNVGTLTRGVDLAHVDMIAILRATESISLLQQIIGRGLRLSPETGKTHCMIYDYAQNLERFCPDGDIFEPEMQLPKAGKKKDQLQLSRSISLVCPQCQGINTFQRRALPEGVGLDKYGYQRVHGDGELLVSSDGEPLSGHRGVRCVHYVEAPGERLKRCPHTWSAVECDECGAANSINNSECKQCGHPLKSSIDERLRAEAFTPDKGVYSQRIAEVTDISGSVRKTRKGVEAVVLNITAREMPYLRYDPEREDMVLETPRSEQFRVWVSPFFPHPAARTLWRAFTEGCVTGEVRSPRELAGASDRITRPRYILYRARPSSDNQDRFFYDITGYHQCLPGDVSGVSALSDPPEWNKDGIHEASSG